MWAKWNARERADVVRQHAGPKRLVIVRPGMSVKDLASLFGITEAQVRAVLGGADFPPDEELPHGDKP